MANVRILMWNIKSFSESVVTDLNRLNRIINRVHPAVGGPLCDIFIIIEPSGFAKPTNIGQLAAGSSVKGLQTIFYALHHRDNAWRMVPPRVLTTSDNKEIHGVYYYSNIVTFVGPDNMVVTSPAALAALPAVLGPAAGFGMAVLPAAVHAYGANPGVNAPVGRVRHSNNVNIEVTFPDAGNRRPYLCQFQTMPVPPAPVREFDVYSHHAAPESKHPENANGILAFANVHEIGAGRTRPVLITGDFNCCNMVNPCPNKTGGHHPNEQNAQWRLTGQGTQNHAYRAKTLEALRAASQATDTAATAPIPPATVVTQAQAVGPFVTAAENAGIAVANAIGPLGNAALLALTVAANTALANLAGANAGNAVVLAVAARNAAIAIAVHLASNYGAPVHLGHYSTAVRQTAQAIDQAGTPANALAAVQAVGAAVTNACADLYPNLSPAQHGTATVAAAAATSAVLATPNKTVLAQAARDALRTVAELQYKTHIRQQLSSLKTPPTATSINYRSHAFDHILTNGFDAEAGAAVVDVVGTDPNWNPAWANVNQFRAFYRRIFKGPGGDGISDHMPVQITITLN